MLRVTIAATALVLAATPVMAQDSGSGDKTNWDELIRTRDITGGAVYTTDEAHGEGSWGGEGDNVWGWSDYDAVGSDWNQIGEIEDVVLSKSGELKGVVVEVGGFLDLGDKHVMLRVDDVDLVPVDDRNFVMITKRSEEELRKCRA